MVCAIHSQWNSDLQVQESRNKVSETRVKSIQDILLLPDEPPPLPPKHYNERPRMPPKHQNLHYQPPPPQYTPQQYGSLSNYENGQHNYAPSYTFSHHQSLDDFSNPRQRPYHTQNYLPGNGYQIYEVPDPPDEIRGIYPQHIRHQYRHEQNVQPTTYNGNSNIYRTRNTYQQVQQNARPENDANSAGFLINPLNVQNNQQLFLNQHHNDPSATKVNVYKSTPITFQSHQSSLTQVDSESTDLSNQHHVNKQLQENVANQKLKAAATTTRTNQKTVITQPEQAVTYAVNVRQQGNLVKNSQSEKIHQNEAESSNIQGNSFQALSTLSPSQVDEALKVLTHLKLLQATQQPIPLNPFSALLLAASFKRHPYLRT
ncbi:hypothetical protein C0J52_24775 [Blattella germanica]|nr:hypothetical protein C0J52_24775 [Blattella germanica]